MAENTELAEEEQLQEVAAAEDEAGSEQGVATSTALISALVIVSRLTGFVRTWAQAFAVGATVLASCYEVANNLPTQIYELVTAGMLVTAFLPVYVSVKKKLGQKGANEYVSNLVSIVTILTGLVTLVSFIFAEQVIWTQSFSAAEDFDASLSTWFFRFFVIEIVLYALSTIFSGVVNAERDYFWSSVAPIFNNLVVIASYLGYAFLAKVNPTLALLVLALGNPLGVLVQVLLQVPSMRRHGIKLRWRVDFSDPALSDTVKIGVPSILVMVCSFVTNSLQLNALLSFEAIGGAISTYAILWYNLPYAVFCVPVMTVLFTEFSDRYAVGDMDSFKRMVAEGAGKILFMLVPFMIYIIVYADQLVTIISASRFDAKAAELCAFYLRWRVTSLPLYGLCMYLQKVCSSTRKMELYAGMTVVCSIFHVILLQVVAPIAGMWMVPFSSTLFFILFDGGILFVLNRDLGNLKLGSILSGALRATILGLAGGAVGMGIMMLMSSVMGSLSASVSRALLTCVVAGIPSVVVTYGIALALKMPEASTITTLANRLLRR